MTDTTSGVEPAIADESVIEQTTEIAEAAPAVNDTDEASKPANAGLQKRIDELTRLRRDAERDRDYWRDHATRQSPVKPEAKEPEAPKKLPKLEDFEYDEAAYQAALTEHISAEAARKVRAEFQEEQAKLNKQQKIDSWRQRETDFASKTPDYIEKAHYAPISDLMAEIIQDSEKGPELAYYFGNNPDEARAIAQMSERQAAVAIGRIEARFEKAPAAAPAPKPVSKAPPPPPKIEATESAPRVSTTSPESDSMSDEEWFKAEQARIKRKAKSA